MRFPALTVLATAQHCTTTPSTLRWNGLDARCYQGHPRIQGPPSHCAALWISENSEARASIAGRGRVEPARGALQARQRGNIRIPGVIASRTGRLQNLQTQRTVNLFWRKGCVNHFQTVVSRKLLSMRSYRWLLSALSGNQRISALSNRKRFSKGVTWDILRFKLAGCHFWADTCDANMSSCCPSTSYMVRSNQATLFGRMTPLAQLSSFKQPVLLIQIASMFKALKTLLHTCSPEGQSGHTWHRPRQSQHYSMSLPLSGTRANCKMQDIWIENKITSVHTGADGGLAALRV